jgi:DeoR/GlpR family transcriptional regulator of sugar metabolism
MLPRERLETIKLIVREEKKVYVSELSEKFNVTKETIRRDLDKLEEQGMAIRSHGGAVLNAKLNEDKQIRNKLKLNMENIKCIAEKITNFIKEGTTIVADYEELTLEVLKLIQSRDDVTLITNSIKALKRLSQSKLNIILTGGSLSCKTQSLQGSSAQEAIKNYNVDIALVSCAGMDISKGILELNEAEAEIKRIMIKQAKKVILLVDQSIFDTTSFVKLFDYEDIDYVVTDKKPREEWIKLFSSYNIESIY